MNVARVVAIVGAMAACGEQLVVDPPATPDAAVPGDAGVVAAPDPRDASSDGATSCAIGAPFTKTEIVPVQGDYSIEAARFHPAGTVAYLSLCPGNGDKKACDLFQGTLFTTGFGAFSPLGASAPGAYDAYPTVTPDGRYLVFASDRGGPVSMYVASATAGTFGEGGIQKLSPVMGAEYSNEPYLLRDGRTLYFSAGFVGARKWEIYRTSGDPPDFGAAPVPVDAVNGTELELAPVVSDDELEIFFASNRRRANEEMALDVFSARRSRTTESFSAPVLEPDLSTPGIDWPVWISPDACDLYFIQKDPTTNVATLRVAHRAR